MLHDPGLASLPDRFDREVRIFVFILKLGHSIVIVIVTAIGVILGLYWENGKENGSY